MRRLCPGALCVCMRIVRACMHVRGQEALPCRERCPWQPPVQRASPKSPVLTCVCLRPVCLQMFFDTTPPSEVEMDKGLWVSARDWG